uniref:Uncharacterized protein n=1 Tax=Anguilla anguilla TaxID=7936 RepID=A0A0E9UX69_ANGAN
MNPITLLLVIIIVRCILHQSFQKKPQYHGYSCETGLGAVRSLGKLEFKYQSIVAA